MTGNNDTLFFKIFSSCNVIAIQIDSFIDILMDCYSNMELLCILIQFTIKIDVNLSLLSVFNAIDLIVLMINNTSNNTSSNIAGETIIEIFSSGFICSKIQTKDNNSSSDNRPSVNNNFECLNVNLKQVESISRSASKKFIDILSTNDNK